jgi:hypothetical protein
MLPVLNCPTPVNHHVLDRALARNEHVARSEHRSRQRTPQILNIDASEIRSGHQPGTRVFTVRSNTLGVPTLFVETTKR